MRKLHLYLLAFILCLAGLGLAYYKAAVIGLPLTTSEEAQVWNIEARISFRAKPDSAIKVTLPLPFNPAGYSILDEDFVSADYGLAIEQDNTGRVARWAKRRAQGKQLLFYRAVLFENEEVAPKSDAAPVYPKPPEYPENLAPVIQGVLDKARQQSADTISFTQRVIEQLNAAASIPELKLLVKHVSRTRNLAKTLSWVLAGARTEDGLRLQDSRRALLAGLRPQPLLAGTNTTIGVVATDAVLDGKAQAQRLAMAGHDGLARSIFPAHTQLDGDTLFALATGASGKHPGMLLLAAMAAEATARATLRAVRAAQSLRTPEGLWLPAHAELLHP